MCKQLRFSIRKINEDEIEIVVTPTYSGCPATSMINMAIKMKLIEKGFNNIRLTNRLSPAWTTDWMTEEGKQKLKAYGIAPPVYSKNNDEFKLQAINNLAKEDTGNVNLVPK